MHWVLLVLFLFFRDIGRFVPCTYFHIRLNIIRLEKLINNKYQWCDGNHQVQYHAIKTAFIIYNVTKPRHICFHLAVECLNLNRNIKYLCIIGSFYLLHLDFMFGGAIAEAVAWLLPRLYFIGSLLLPFAFAFTMCMLLIYQMYGDSMGWSIHSPNLFETFCVKSNIQIKNQKTHGPASYYNLKSYTNNTPHSYICCTSTYLPVLNVHKLCGNAKICMNTEHISDHHVK